jgi:predicted subunit of tRNA(5-methylaminomethyl-2-thiouridylate) methyltransferase
MCVYFLYNGGKESLLSQLIVTKAFFSLNLTKFDVGNVICLLYLSVIKTSDQINLCQVVFDSIIYY